MRLISHEARRREYYQIMKQKLVITGFLAAVVLFLGVIGVFIRNGLGSTAEQKVMTEFKALMDKNTQNVEEIVNYLDAHINELSQRNAASLVRGLERGQKAYLPALQEKYDDIAVQKELAHIYEQQGWSLADLSGIHNDDVKKIIMETLNYGFKVETAEGMFFPVIDYAFYDRYQRVLPADMVAYIGIMKIESDQTPVKDAALMIGWDEVIKRALKQERFIKDFSSSRQKDAVQQLLERYVTFALYGANNTPLFQYDTRKMEPEAKRIYRDYPWTEKQGGFSAVMKAFQEVLERSDYSLTPEVENFRKNALASFSRR